MTPYPLMLHITSLSLLVVNRSDPFRKANPNAIGVDDTEYVDGGLYRTETAGLSGAGYSAGRGGAGNVKAPATASTGSAAASSDRRDSINEESVVPAPKEGEGYSTGRGGGGNVHRAGAASEKDSHVHAEGKKGALATLGLAYLFPCKEGG